MTTIKLKNGSGAPAASDLVQGEPALDLTNKRLYTEDSGGNVIEVGTNPTSLTTGAFTSNGIDDNASSTSITIASGGDVTIDGTDASTSISSTAILNLKAGDADDEYSTLRFATSANGSIGYVGAKATTTGAYPNSVGNLQFGVQNGSSTVTAMTIDNTGDVGIGETTPTSKLHVYGSNGAGSRIHIESGGAGLTSFDGSGSGLLMTANGMNTTSKFTPAIQFGSTDPQLTTINPKVGAAINGIATEAYSADTDGGMGMVFYTRPNNDGTDQDVTERMRIDSSGNVGIGAATVDTALHIEKANPVIQLEDSTNGFIAQIDGENGGLAFKADTANASGSATNITFDVDGSERMRITQTGLVGIGTDSPSYLLDVAGSGDVRARVRTTGTNSTDDAIFTLQVASTTANSTIEFGDSADRDVGRIIYGHNSNIMRFYVSADEKMRLESDGDLQVEGSVVGSSSVVSDERFKDDVTTITGALDTVDSLRGVTFTWNAGKNTGDTDYGFIAQEVEQVIPEIVHDKKLPLFSGDEDTVYKTVDYARVCAVLVEAVSELRAEVQSLETRLAAVEAN